LTVSKDVIAARMAPGYLPSCSPEPTPFKPALPAGEPRSLLLLQWTAQTAIFSMRQDFETLLETVLAAVMAPDTDALTLATQLHGSLADTPVITVIRALLAADRAIVETFNTDPERRGDAALARGLALTLAEAADALSDDRGDPDPIRLGDLIH
jgi:hypothetical protein